MMSPPRRRTLALALALAATVAAAQMPGGGSRGSRGGGYERPPAMPEGQPPATRSTQPTDPVFPLERELPSLRADLGLNEAQAALWGPFERSVRDAAELTRQRTKKMMAPRPVDAPAPNAVAVMNALAEDERMRSDAFADAAARLKALYESLTPAQRALFDRRVLLSQSQPLGSP
jgi:hypothetical protein